MELLKRLKLMRVNNSLVLVSIKKHNYTDVVKFLVKNKIYYRDLVLKDDEILLKVEKGDYKFLKSYFKSVYLIKYLGLNGFLSFIKKHYILMCSFIVTYFILLVLSNVIFDIEIITNNNELKRVITLYLEDNDIKKYKFMKSNSELNKIKSSILEENKDTLEWVEIERKGTTYVINLTERVINDVSESTDKTDIVAKKDATIKYLITKSGTKLKEVNEIVKKGDIIITGNIIKNEEVVDTVKAEGEVYGEVWYTVNTTVPYTHVEYEKTGEVVNHIYVDLFGKKFTIMGKYDTEYSMNDVTTLIDKPYLFFKVMKEEKNIYKYVTHNLTEDEAYEEAIKRSDKSINAKLGVDEYIIDKKVLKKNVYSSKIELEIFYRVYENIGISQELTPMDKPEGE